MDTQPEEYTRTFPAPATPTANALLNDWRFYDYIIRINALTDDKHPQIIEPPYSTMQINADTKIKGKNKHNLNLFVLTIPTPPAITETPAEEK